VRVHLKLDTGMGRLGAQLHELPAFLETLAKNKHVRLEGVFSHFASSEIVDEPSNDAQVRCFDKALEIIRQSGIEPTFCHIANSAAIMTRKSCWYNMVRAGLVLYGYHEPFVSTEGQIVPDHQLPIEPVLSWKTRVIEVKDVPAGYAIGYNGTFVTSAPSRLALLPAGYADGLSRLLSGRGRVIVRGAYAPIVGKISMDLCEIDVSRIPGVSVGDEVTIIGSKDGCTISAFEHADLSSTIPYEVLCSIGRRVPRVHID
jgi:alanine racemase